MHPDWISNSVLVEMKKDEPAVVKIWRMCIDFTNLKKACPKDPFPLPQIDQVIDSTAGVTCCPSLMLTLVSTRSH